MAKRVSVSLPIKGKPLVSGICTLPPQDIHLQLFEIKAGMASHSCIILAFFIAVSFASMDMALASRHLLQTTLPPLPTVPTLPQGNVPPLPTAPSLPLPSIPNIPTIPTLPQVTLPPLPTTSLPNLPSIPTIPSIPFLSPPPSTTTP
ncbi:IgA FC receptor [Spatholobus suberectus]|nr:IgA FC receptor [Spatholobus suberectus]